MKRTAAADGPDAMEDVKRPNTEGEAEREHVMLTRVLQPETAPAAKLSLAGVYKYLDDITTAKARQPNGLHDALLHIATAWKRSEDGAIPTTWVGIPPLHEEMKNCALVHLAVVSAKDQASILAKLLDHPVPGALVNAMLSSLIDEAKALLMMEICRPLKGRTINLPKSAEFGKLVRVLKADKKAFTEVLVTSPCLEAIWRPVFEPKFVWRNKKGEVTGKQRPGFFLESESLLGWVLSPSALDGALAPPSRPHICESGSNEWHDVRRISQQAIEGKQRGTRIKLIQIQTQAFEVVDMLVKGGNASRIAVFEWLGTVLMAAEPRGKMGHIIPEGFNFWPQQGNHVIDVLGHAETAPIDKQLKNLLLLQVLQARIQGFPTSGVALNTFALLLHLAKPIKCTEEVVATISPNFVLREDVPEFLGSWDKEARFGEKEQLEKAKELAKTDECFTAPASDKKLFKTEIFWLASKGVGTLLLPVAKEAFHTFQGIASVFYEKDRPNSDTAWREYLLSEAALKEPGFVENLAHFVNLQFRFLCHAASGGKQALPPQEPGPMWHALPSVMLENLLDICDLYRDRQAKKSGQIATGIYALLDPEPILTTLFIVMASDDHVKDPSLRGRAVKLMHRLCTAFHSWQEKLNQPPLRDHLIPCLVGVFTGVEKAIMSYYDLSYRYKYELRQPIMELFDMASHHEAHQKVFKAFVSGDGNERFLKMMTQLINDSNSQQEEAIRTLKDYASEKAKGNLDASGMPLHLGAPGAPTAAAPAAGATQHNEEVVGDDEGATGEDVYRRSRMNYKEHAKKYFALSTRSWKFILLLCKQCAGPIIDGQGGTILEQLIHTSLNAQLHHLVGPMMKDIKATPQDYVEVEFEPKELVRQIAEIFLALIRQNRDEVVRVVAKDERYYKPGTFSKAVNFMRKYNLMKVDEVTAFDSFVKELAEKAVLQKEAFDSADIPENFLCEMMADIMSDPVMLPQSKKIIDRNTAWRTIAGTDKDPYANTHVTMDMLIPQTELKEEIHRFAKANGIELEGGNMFA